MIPQLLENPTGSTSQSVEPGRRAAREARLEPPQRRVVARLNLRRDQIAAIVARASRSREDERIIRTAARETRDLGRSLRRHPVVRLESGEAVPRACAVAFDYLAAAKDAFS